MVPLPDSLRSIRPLTLRVSEVEAKYPLVAYFCRMECVSRIIATGAHSKDAQAGEYAEQLMNELEEFKSTADSETKEILNDEKKSAEYMTTFARGVLARAQNQMANHQVTAATGHTLLAAVSFLEVCALWGDETDNIKFCKYHAARILKEVQEKRDPNELYQEQSEDEAQDEELEKELNAMVAQSKSSELPDKEDETSEESQEAPASVLPSAPSAAPQNAPESPAEPQDTALPSTPAAVPGHKLPAAPQARPNDFGLPEAPESQPVVFDYESAPKAPTIKQFTEKAAAPAAPKPSLRSVISEAETTGKAQKHARHAVSALNYDDYKTAIIELEAALALLRAAEHS